MIKPAKLKIKATLKILKPPHEVFEAIVDPAGMTNYFISKSTGRMEEGKILSWQFSEFDLEFPVRVEKIEEDKYISFLWDDWEDNTINTLVEITLEPKGNDETLIKITEESREQNEAALNGCKAIQKAGLIF
jgi:uncharacterized protein YndB with AHSA1/START domain